MTPEELERLAREAGLEQQDYRRDGVWLANGSDLTRFAALVSAQALEDAARACDRRVMGDLNREDMEARACAAAIRALAAPQSPAADQSAP